MTCQTQNHLGPIRPAGAQGSKMPFLEAERLASTLDFLELFCVPFGLFSPPLLCPLASVPSPVPTSLHRNLAIPTKRPLKLYCSQRASVQAFEASFANLLMRMQKAGMDFSTVTQPRCNLQFSVVSPKIFRSSSEKQHSFLFNSYCP